MSEPTLEQQLDEALEEIKKLHFRIADLNTSLAEARRVMESERLIAKHLGEENTRLRERVLGVVQRYGPNERCCSVEINAAAFHFLENAERESYLRHAVIDAVDRLLHKVSGSSYLVELRHKVRG